MPEPSPTDRPHRHPGRRTYRRRRLAAATVAVAAVVAVVVLAASGGGRGGATGPSEALAARSGPPPADRSATVRLTAVGDIVMGSPPYGLPPDGGASFFHAVRPLLTGDVVMGNLEGTLATGGASKCGSSPGPNCFAFRTPPSYARWLRRAGFTLMNVANNHAYDFGAEGQRETLAALRAHGLRAAGRPGQITIQTVRGVRVAVVGFAPYPWAASLLDIPAAKRLVARAAREASLVVVVIHAGAEGGDRAHVPAGDETYLGEDRGNSRAFAHAVIDAGADLVWGSGPHVLRGMEAYRGHLIAYSLGNFAGYRVFGLGGPLSTGGVLQVTLRADGRFVSGRLRPTRLVSPGLPAPGGDGVSLVASLSRTDFGARAARIAANGRITLPR